MLKKVFHFLHLTGGVKYDCNNNIHKYKFQVKRKYLHFLLKKPYLGILKKVIPFLKSAPSNSSKTKSREKKTINLGPKMPYLGVLKPQFHKTIVIFEISYLDFVKIEFLTDTVNFGIGFAFSEGPGV